MQPGSATWRILLAVVVVGLLLLPGVLTALAWTPLNFLIALASIGGFLWAVWRFPKWALPIGIVAMLVISIPPYPNWLWLADGGGVELHLGQRLRALDLTPFAPFFVASAFLLLALAWLVRGLRRGGGTAQNSLPDRP